MVKILIADYTSKLGKSITTFLNLKGIDTVLAINYGDAIKELNSCSDYTCLLYHLSTGECDDNELSEIAQKFPELPIIGRTAQAMNNELKREICQEYELVDIIFTPFTPDWFVNYLKELNLIPQQSQR